MTARLAALAVVAVAALPACERDGVDPPAGDIHAALALPRLVEPDTAAASLDPATLRGTPSIVVLYRPSCRYCIDELPIVSRIAAAHGARAIAVHVQGDQAQSRRLLDQLAFDGIAVVDDGRLLKQWKIRGVPYTVFVDGNGKAVKAYAGAQSESVLTAALASIRR